jgi:hypothetical protein
MADGSEHKLYQIVVKGGQPFTLESETLPSFRHEGKTTAGSLMLTPAQVAYVEQALKQGGCQVEIRCEGGKPSEGNYIYEQCKGCPWACPEQAVNSCGWRAWADAVKDSLLRASPAHRQSLQDCPGE